MGLRSKISIVLADRHELVRAGIRLLLEAEPGFSVLGAASTASHALKLVENHKPDVLVACPEIAGHVDFELARQVSERSRRTRVVLLSMYEGSDGVVKALRSGASGYILKESSAAELVRAIREAAAGRRYLSPLLRTSEIEAQLRRGRAGASADILTERQRQVLHLVAEGLSSTVIGRRLRISPRTVEAHRATAIRRLGLSSRTDLIRYAFQHGILALRSEPLPPVGSPDARRQRSPRRARGPADAG
jgi:DNA-binding NarL/FixJ family response regulator